MVKKSLVGVGLLGLAAYLYLRNKGGSSVSENNVLQEMAMPEIKENPLKQSLEKTINQLQNTLDSKESILDNLLNTKPGVISEEYIPVFNWQNIQTGTKVSNEEEVQRSVDLLQHHKNRIMDIHDENTILRDDIRQLNNQLYTI